MTFQKNIILSVALGASVSFLGACSLSYPHSMPTGYTHHHKTYQSPGAETTTEPIVVEQRQYMSMTQAKQFRNGIYNLLEKLTSRAGMPPKPVYILGPQPTTSFYANLDNHLRSSMRHIGYDLASSPEGAYIFTYDAMPLMSVDEGLSVKNNVQLTLNVFTGMGESSKQLTQETGAYFIEGAEHLNIIPAHYATLPLMMGSPMQHPVAIAPPVSAPILKAPIVDVPEASPVPVPMMAPVVAQPVPSNIPPLLAEPLIKPPVAPIPSNSRVSLPPPVEAPYYSSAVKPPVTIPLQPNRIPSGQSRAVLEPVPEVVIEPPRIEPVVQRPEPLTVPPLRPVEVPVSIQAPIGPMPDSVLEGPSLGVSIEKKPSREDIVIINRDVELPEPPEVGALPVIPNAMPSDDIVRGRVSLPSSYR